jgi:hypothetical protein
VVAVAVVVVMEREMPPVPVWVPEVAPGRQEPQGLLGQLPART